MKYFLMSFVVVMLAVGNCHAGLKILGKGDGSHFDASGFPPAMKANYEIMRTKCVKCHTMERTVIAITTGIAPITFTLFDRNATKKYGIKMMRKPDSNMNKEDVRATVELMNYLLDQAVR